MQRALQPGKMTLLPLIAATFFMVSGGPFGVEDTVAKSGYAAALLILLITPVIWSFPTALMVSELSSAIPAEGGYYVWVTRGLGRFWGYQEAWLSMAGSIFDMGIYPTLFVDYLGHFAPWATAGHRGLFVGVGLIAACALWNLLGSETVGGSSVALGTVLLAPFVVLTVYACFHRESGAAHSIPLGHADILAGILVAMWNYMGWDYASTVAGEVERPQWTYPRAMAGAVALVCLCYLLPVAAVALTGLDPNQWSTGGWADVARAVLRNGWLASYAATVITFGAMLGAAGSLNANVMAYSRIPAVLAEDGFLPRIFARCNRTGAPWVSIAACCVLWASSLGLSFTKLVLLDVLLTGLSILLEFAALVALRLREPELYRPYRVPGGLTVAIAIGLPPLGLLVLTVMRNEIEPVGPLNALQFGALLIAAGVAAYFVSPGRRKRLPHV
jgi:amino acid transporter